jgi:hypothetical protein
MIAFLLRGNLPALILSSAGVFVLAAFGFFALLARDHHRRDSTPAETPRIVADTTAVLPRIREPKGGKHRRRRHRPVRIVRHATPPPPRVEPLRSPLGIWPVVPPQGGRDE